MEAVAEQRSDRYNLPGELTGIIWGLMLKRDLIIILLFVS